VTEASDSSIATGAALSGTGIPWNSEIGCMRIMKESACKPDASQSRLRNQRFRSVPRVAADSFWAIAA
jgi:hypothetical protein